MKKFLVIAAMGAALVTGCASTDTSTTDPYSFDTSIPTDFPTDLGSIAPDTSLPTDIPTDSVPQGPTLTDAQQNAASSAQQYLDMGNGFSRRGLIDQLSSKYGSGYSVADATAAVDSLDVDWNAQAALSGKSYMGLQAFSCNGLIRQLSSSFGAKFTLAQARYGARAAGAC